MPGIVESHIRIEDARLRRLLEDALPHSPSLRALVARLERSDLLVYVRFDPTLSRQLVGHLTFVSRLPHARVLLIRLQRVGSDIRQVASLGHEFHHAVEVADAPLVEDEAGLEREFRRIGFPSRSPASAATFETDAAIEVTDRILRELQRKPTRDAGQLITSR